MRKRRTKREGTRESPSTPDMVGMFERQLEAFRQKFGREPGPEDPVFFDPIADTPQTINPEIIEWEIAEAMRAVGIDPEIIYATQKTGLIPTEETWPRMTPAERREWNDAIAEYERVKEDRL